MNRRRTDGWYSRVRRALPSSAALAAGALLALSPGRAAGQDTTGAPGVDSLLALLRSAEARLEVLEKQVAAQAEAGVRTRSGFRAELSGRVLVNGFFNSQNVNNVDNPQFVLPLADRGIGMSPRQSSIRLAIAAPDIAGGHLAGDVDIDFNGGQQPSSGGRTFPLVRLRTARAALRWQSAEVMVGQEVPLVSPLNPNSLAAIGTPLFATSGNLWLWLPQVRATVESRSAVRIGLQGAVLAPTSGDAVAAFETDFDAAERSMRPYLQARVYARTAGDADHQNAVGCGGHLGWIDVGTSSPTRAQSSAVACDVRFWAHPVVEVRGELFAGQALRGLGGGGIGQGLAASTTSGAAPAAVPTRGGWAQVTAFPGRRWSLGAACGRDDPDDDVIGAAATARLRNDSCAGHVVLRPFDPVFIGAEGRRTTTRYRASGVTNDHFNVAIGFEF